MPEKRFFADCELAKDKRILLDGEEAHHMMRVMRCKEGDTIELINGKGALAYAQLAKAFKEKAEILIKEVYQAEKDPFEIILAQAIPRANRLDIILEKGTELGFTKLCLFPGMHSEKKSFTETNEKRMDKILLAAVKQCGRLYMPEIALMPPLSKWNKPAFPSYFGDVDPSASPFSTAWHADKPSQGVIFFIGPEQGFHPEEEQLLRNWGAKGVKLHPNILRTDTAPLCALSLISHFLLHS